MNNFLEVSFFGNTLKQYAISIGVLGGGLFALWLVHRVILRRVKGWAAGSDNKFDDFLVAAVEKAVVPLLVFGAFMFAAKRLALSPNVTRLIDGAGPLLLTILSVRLGIQSARYFLIDVWARARGDSNLEKQVLALMPLIKGFCWLVGIVFLLDNWGFKISTLVAGLGIGGVAVALAAQAVLGDLFSYFSIMFDRPFEIGDFIIQGEYMGTVEQVGIKTTRIRSLGGEQLVFSNTDLTSSRVRNYKRMQLRRVVFTLGVTYDTGLAHLKAIPGMIKEIIERVDKTRFDRAHFSSFGDFSLGFEAVYYVLSNDYNIYMDTQQAINFAIKEAFERAGIAFAFPTQTIHLNTAGGPANGPLPLR